jgi:predicted DNA-binding transcriptional regulator AlpA
MTSTSPPQLCGHIEAAARLGVSPATLRGWRCKGHGPRFLKFGPSRASGVAYYIEDIDAWLAERKYSSTTEHSEAVRAAGLEAGRYRTVPNLPITPPWQKPEAEQSVA